jgi:hypothetical protein
MIKPDVFDPTKEYVFVNTSDVEFRCKYGNPEFSFSANPKYSQEENRRLYEEAFKRDGVREVVVPPGGMYQCKEWLGYHLMKHFVDKEIIRNAEKQFGPLSRNKNEGKPNVQGEDVILNMNSPASRDDLEKGCLKLIKNDEESPIVERIRQEERDKITATIRQEERAKAQQEFAGANQPTISVDSPTGTKKVKTAPKNETTLA